MDIQEFIKARGFDFQPSQLDGQYHEFSDSLGNKGWYIGSTLESGKITFTFGDWRRPGTNHTFLSSETLTANEKSELEQTHSKFQKIKLERQLQAKKLASDIFHRYEQKGSDGESVYLKNKKLPPRIPGTIVKPCDSGHALIIPMRDESGEIWNFQTIFDSGDKIYFNFARVEGLFFEIPRGESGDETTYVCEGFATGFALHISTGARVIVAFTLSNLKNVAPKFPGSVLALDNDESTRKAQIEKGHKNPENPGRDIGGRLALSIGCDAVMPPGAESVDFSDLYVQGGREAVVQGIQLLDLTPFGKLENFDSAPNPTPAQNLRPHVISRWVNGLEPMDIRFTKGGKVILPEEVEVAEKLYSYYEGALVRFETDFFVWSGKHWRRFTEDDESRVMQQIMVLHGGYGTHSRFRSIYRIFQTMVPGTNRNMFFPNPHRITFNNGTLAIDFIGGNWTFNFREHRKEDFSTNLIPYDYDPDAKNPLFDETLKNVLGDKEFETKLRAVRQMFGSALAPMYPRLFLLVGKPGSGKSTLIVLATALVSDGNVSSVQPSDFHGFGMEPMAGKLVNAVTDLDVAKPIADAVIKQIEDRIPVAINRKHKAIIRAPFPAVHIFGANDIPPTLERGSMAHTRRWTFILMDHFQRTETEHDKHRVDRIREAGMAGVINFAIEGLKDLLNNQGHFFVPDSGAKRLREWQIENDPIASFLEAVRDGEWEKLEICDDGRCSTKVFWEEFCAWHKDVYNTAPKIPKHKFMRKLKSHLGVFLTVNGYKMWRGVAYVDPSCPNSWIKGKGGRVTFSGDKVTFQNKKSPVDPMQNVIENLGDSF